MREQKGWDLLQASCRQPSFSIYLQSRTVRSPSACQDTHTYCTPLVLSICSFEILFVFLISIEFSDSSLYHTLRICACISESVCVNDCFWKFSRYESCCWKEVILSETSENEPFFLLHFLACIMSYLFIIFSSIKQLVMFSKIVFDGGAFVPVLLLSSFSSF